jgi:hypothetical protein
MANSKRRHRLECQDTVDDLNPKPERRVTPDRRANPRGGRRSTDSQAERDLRAERIAEYQRKQQVKPPE